MTSKRSIMILFMLHAIVLAAQQWPTLGGGNLRNGYSRMIGPAVSDQPVWTVNSANYSAWGNTVLVFGDRFVCARTQLTPYTGKLECRRLSDGALYWEFSVPGGKLYAVGFDDYAVYVHDYATDAFYALDPADGSIRWIHPEAVSMFGGTAGILFACNGDPVVIGKRIDRYTGETVWQYDYTVPVSPDAGYAAYGATYYHWEGSIFTPKRLIAVDMESGQLRYESEALDGDGDQEWPICLGPEGNIYIARDGGPLYAFKDNGSALVALWSSPIQPESRITTGRDGSLYFFAGQHILRLSAADGSVLDTSSIVLNTSFQPIITADSDGRIYVDNAGYGGLGRYYCLSSDLQTLLWQHNVATNYYAGVAPGRDGTVVVFGEGNAVRAYRYAGQHRPIADFTPAKTLIAAGESINFSDRSSFQPSYWKWYFEGAEQPFSTDQNPTGIQYASPGVYSVTLIAGNDLGADTLVKSCAMLVQQASGTAAAAEAVRLQVFPQPAAEQLWIQAPEGSKLEIRCLAGGRVFYTGSMATPQKLVRVSDWPSGAYYARVLTPSGRMKSQKILVLR